MFAEKFVQRFFSQIKKHKDCWEWQGFVCPEGYGRFSFPQKQNKEGRGRKASRFSYLLHKGIIPKGFHVDHICRNKKCVNPEHLRAVTPRENILSSNNMGARHARQKTCHKGHPFSHRNINQRLCRICAKEWHRKYYLERRYGV